MVGMSAAARPLAPPAVESDSLDEARASAAEGHNAWLASLPVEDWRDIVDEAAVQPVRPDLREVFRKISAFERVNDADAAILRAHMTPAELDAAEEDWGITLEFLLKSPVHPDDAPFDDEPLTAEDIAAIAEARASTGPTYTSEQLLRSLAL